MNFKSLFFVTLILTSIIITSGCKKEEAIHEVTQEVTFPIPDSVEDSVLVTLKEESNQASTRTSWKLFKEKNIQSNGGYSYVYGFSRTLMENYDIKVKIKSNKFGYLTIHGYSPFRLDDYITTNSNWKELVGTSDNLIPSENALYFHTFSIHPLTSYDIKLYYKKKNSAPAGWLQIQSGNGVKLYKKSYQGGNPDYVQEIDLSKASLAFYQGNNNVTASPSNPSPALTKRDFHSQNNSYWSLYGNSNNIFSIVNAAFFGLGSQSAFPIKFNGTLISAGYGNNENLPKRKLEINGSYADIKTYSNTSNNYSTVLNNLGSVPTVMVGLHPTDAPKSKYSYVGRTFIGVSSSNSSKIYIYSTVSNTQLGAYNVLKNEYGISGSKIVMLDGGGSSQMTCKGNNYVNSTDDPDRKIPSIIAVYE